MGAPNRWLAKAHYSPSGARTRSLDRTHRARPEQAPSEEESDTKAGGGGLAPKLKDLAQLALFLAAVVNLLNSPWLPVLHRQTNYIPTILNEAEQLLASLELERALERREAEKVLSERSRGGDPLFRLWNKLANLGGTSRHLHGKRKGKRYQFYIPVPRKGMEDSYDLLHLRGGFRNLQLHVIEVPEDWKSEEVSLHKFGWAYRCHVKPEMIDLWSSFRVRDGNSELVNGCVPGGTCLVISDGEPDAGAFDDVDFENEANI